MSPKYVATVESKKCRRKQNKAKPRSTLMGICNIGHSVEGPNHGQFKHMYN